MNHTPLDTGTWIVFEDEAGQSMTSPRARTWGRVGHTPVVHVRGRGSGRVSMAVMSCYNVRLHLTMQLKQIQYHPDLVDGALAGTGLIMDD